MSPSPEKGAENMIQAKEIKLEFSPTKLEKCFVTESQQRKDFDEIVERHNKNI